MSPLAGWGQSTLFRETMGTVGSNTAISVHESNNGFDNDAYTMTDGGAANPADIRSSSASTGAYSGASGGANVFFTTTNERGFAIEGIEARGFSGLTLSFAVRKESASGTSFGTLLVEYWDGSAYQPLTVTGLPATNSGAGWSLITGVQLPVAAQINGLKIRFRKTAGSMRVDDVELKGTDTGAPAFLAGYPAVNSVTTSGFAAVTKLSEAGSTYFVVVADNATAPTVAEVKAAQQSGGAPALASGTISTGATAEGSSTVTGLAAGTNYDVYFVAADNVTPTPNTQTTVVKVEVATLAVADTTPPAFAAGSPISSNVTVTGFTLSSTIDEVGATYYVVLASGAAAPSAGQVKAGQDATGTQAVVRGTFANPTAGTAATVVVSGLAGSTSYEVYVVAEDAVPNLQATPVTLAVTTPAPPPVASGFTPGSGPVGTTITIAGNNLSTITSVTVGGVAATAVTSAPSSVTATVAAGTPLGANAVVASDGTASYTVPGSFTLTAAPTVTTAAVASIATTSATSGGTVVGNNATITGRGVVYGTSPAPRIGNPGVGQLSATGTTGSFTSNLTGLTAATTYYVAAYASSEFGTTYATDQTFTTAAPPTGLFEDFEVTTPTKTGYGIGTVATATGSWTFDEAAVGNLANDKKNGTKAARLRGGSVYMNFNKANGAGTVTINGAAFGSDAPSSYALDISTDNGTTFTAYNGPATLVSSTLAATSFTVNIAGNIRLRVRHADGTVGSNPRLNIDDITITDFAGTGTAISAPVFSGTSFCSTTASSFNAEFTPTGTFATANDFLVQLSDAAGSFANPVIVGTVSDNATNGAPVAVSITIPAGTATGTGYKLRVVANDPGTTGTASAALTILNSPTVSVAPGGAQTLVVNTDGAPLTATETPAAISRQWYYSTVANGPVTAIANATGVSYTPNFAAAGTYYVTVVSTFAACGSQTSNPVVITVSAPVATLTATPSTLTLTAPTNQSATRDYQLQGSNLPANATVELSSNNAAMDFSLNGGASYAAAATLTASNTGAVNQVVRVRFTAPAAVGTTTATISNTSGALSAPVTITGEATPPPVTTAFGPGNLAVVRVGDGSTALTTAAAPVFIDEYTPAGDLVRSIALPTSTSGSNYALTANGSSTTNGMIMMSPNRQFITLAGFNAAPGTSSVASAAGVERVVGLVTANGAVNTSTRITDGYLGGDIRSAVTTDGNGFWTAGNGGGSGANTATGGTRYVALGSSGVSTQVSSSPANTRLAAIYFDQLYVSTASGSNVGVNSVGTGMPTASGQSTTLASGLNAADAYGYVFFDLTDAVAGPDVVYVADGNSGIRKYSLLANGNWVQNGAAITAGTGLRGLAGSRDATGIRLFATNASTLYTVLDDVAYNAAPRTSTLTSLATSATNQAFRGVAFAPGSPVVLPVVLTRFAAERQKAAVVIRWTTSSERNSAHFEVQRSVNGKDFEVVTTVAGQGQSTRSTQYEALDQQATAQLAYYRLRQVDLDGTAAFSPVATVRPIVDVQLYPNPVEDVVQIQMPQSVGGVNVQITDLTGRLVTQSILDGAGQMDVRGLPPGTYLIHIGEGIGRITRTLVKR
ncbi:T9SS type A sorting domain-containing protein [Hymenobacter metallicola]|uniref:T9SS type A sorting domain-containing protein n=1 Tax=Hymenobacter metallicola TaxID=2563114 RepID=UPI0014367898|nr:T9SS type A sorting domain-containing protein [Hymenobacter metallicola]